MDVLKPPLVHLGGFSYRINAGDMNSYEPSSSASYDELETLDDQHYGSLNHTHTISPAAFLNICETA